MNAVVTGALWGYAEGEPVIVGIVVAIVAAAALGFVGHHLWRQADARRKRRR